ncbi:MAG: nuclease-related domain-containing protein [Steroidobacteraceae bacterium]
MNLLESIVADRDPLLIGLGVAGIIVLVAAAGIIWRWHRHRRALRRLEQSLSDISFEYRRNVAISDGADTLLHIDYLLLTPRGVVLVDLRDVRGNIFGGDQMTQWTVMHPRSRSTFENPQGALLDRIAAVKRVAADLSVEGRIVFGDGARFPKGVPSNTLLLGGLTADLPVVDRQALRGIHEAFAPAWQNLLEALQPSPLRKPRAVVS